jgi:hypothetical protein
MSLFCKYFVCFYGFRFDLRYCFFILVYQALILVKLTVKTVLNAFEIYCADWVLCFIYSHCLKRCAFTFWRNILRDLRVLRGLRRFRL